MDDNTETKWFKKISCEHNNDFTESKEGVVTFHDENIKLAINEIIINKLQSEKENIENIAMSVIAKYKTKLTEHINEKIYNKLIEGLDSYLKSNLEKKEITRKIVLANVKNFRTLIDEKSDKDLIPNYTNLLKLGNICKAEKVAVANKIAADAKKAEDKAREEAETATKAREKATKAREEAETAAKKVTRARGTYKAKAETAAKKAEKEAEKAEAAAEKAKKVATEAIRRYRVATMGAMGGTTLIHKKTHTRKSNKKKRERKTRRIRGGTNCINVEEICKKVTSLISTQNQLFMNTTEIELTGVAELKTQIENICLEKTNEILDQIAKQAIDYGALNEILKYLIVEMTNLVKSNMRNSKDFLCKNV